jgi:insulysin
MRPLLSLCFVTLLLSLPAERSLAEERSGPRETRALTLDNGIRVFLVSDKEADHSAAALAVNVGSMNDAGRYGLAHFLEHMLFLGTKKYPEAGEYSDYLSQNDGSSNAYTAYDHTNYFFEVKTEAFEGALDRFSRFFIDPLMTDTLSEREVQAVNSEHSKNLENDFWRARQIFRSLVNPKHPQNTFSTGDKKTLAGVDNAELVAFYKGHYSSKLMTLCLISNHPLDALEGWARAKFTEVPDRGHQALTSSESLLAPRLAGHRVDVEPVQDLRQLWLKFELTEEAFAPSSKSHAIVGSVLGHEGRESLLQQLKLEGLATSLSAGGEPIGQGGTFNLTIGLTKAGLADVDGVMTRVFGMINHLRSLKPGLPPHLIDSEQKMAAINLRFRRPGRPFDEVSGFTASMFRCDHRDLMNQMYLLQKPDSAAIKRVIDALTPSNMTAFVIAKSAETDEIEEHYAAEYGRRPLSEDLVAKLDGAGLVADMGLPAKNDFIPSDFELVAIEHAEKPWAYRFEHGEVWLRHDARFKQPKAALRLQIVNKSNGRSARDFVLGQLYARAVNEALTPYRYPMDQAGMSLAVSSGRAGFTVSAGGYSHKLPKLLEFAASFLSAPRIDAERFGIYLGDLVRALENKRKQPAQQHAIGVFREIIRETHFTDEAQLAACQELSFADLKTTFAEANKEIFIRGLCCGNLSAAQIKKLSDDFAAALAPERALKEEERYRGRVLRFAEGTSARIVKKIPSNDSCAILLYQHEPLDDASRAALQVLNTVMPNKFFQDLRTLQQTGYIVGSFCFEVESVPFFLFMSQSSLYDTSSLRGRFESFIKHCLDDLDETTDAEFMAAKGAATSRIETKRKNLGEELAWNFDAIFERDGDFGYEARQVDALASLTREQWVAASRRFLSEQRVRRVAVEVVGSPAGHRFKEQKIQDLRGAGGFYEEPRRAKAEAPSGD